MRKEAPNARKAKHSLETLKKKTLPFFENSVEVSCNMSYNLLKTWSILRML